jgi:uncharacterized protein (TIGR02266 family)
MAAMLATPARQDDRYPVNLRVDSELFAAASYATNLSRGGLFVAIDKPLPAHSLLEMTLTLPGPGDEIRALGRVVWNCEVQKSTCPRTPGMGVKFLSMSSEDWGRVVAFLAALPQPADAGIDLRAFRASRREILKADRPPL